MTVGPGSDYALKLFLRLLAGVEELAAAGAPPQLDGAQPDIRERQRRQVDQLQAFTQRRLAEAESEREKFFWKPLDGASANDWQAPQALARFVVEGGDQTPAQTHAAGQRAHAQAVRETGLDRR